MNYYSIRTLKLISLICSLIQLSQLMVDTQYPHLIVYLQVFRWLPKACSERRVLPITNQEYKWRGVPNCLSQAA